MTETVEASIEFDFGYPLAEGTAGDFDCRATADVTLYPSSHDDPGGCDIEGFRDFAVQVYVKSITPGKFWEKRWAEPDEHLRQLLTEYISGGACNGEFIEAARENSGPDPDMQREMRREAG